MPREFKTILCGTDFTERSYLALDYALRFATLADGVLIVAHFVHVPSGDLYTQEAWPRTFEEAKARAKTLLTQVHQTRLDAYPNIKAWVQRFQARPAYKAALEKGGAYSYGNA